MHDKLLHQLQVGPLYRFAHHAGLTDVIPRSGAGVYTIWDDEGGLVYAGIAGRNPAGTGLASRLRSHASGRRSGDQFCVYVADHYVLPELTRDQVEAIRDSRVSMDALVREEIVSSFAFRFVTVADYATALEIEAAIKSGGLSAGQPRLNPTTRRRADALELSPAMVTIAALDDPPTVIGDDYLERLAAAGVTVIGPMLCEVPGGYELAEDAEEAAQAIAIYVSGPGLVHPEPLEGDATPVADALNRILFHVERFDQLRRFRLAADDMRLVEQTARQLRDRDGPARFFEMMLETALVVTYARPYMRNNRAGIEREWWPDDEDDLAFHRYVIEALRNPYHAHMDHTPRRTLIDTTKFLGLEGPPTYAQGRHFLTDSELDRLAELARKQGERLEAEGIRIGAELGERREGPRPDAVFFKHAAITGDSTRPANE